MLTAMLRVTFVACVIVAGCGSKSAQGTEKAGPIVDDKVAVPGGAGARVGAPGGAREPIGDPADDPEMRLHPDEGKLVIDKAEAKAGSEVAISVRIVPAAGFHVSTDYRTKLTLEPTAGVTLAKSELAAGGRDKKKGDADPFSEQELAFTVKATADKPGSYEIKGAFKFGVCDKASCHPKWQPIAIQVAAR